MLFFYFLFIFFFYQTLRNRQQVYCIVPNLSFYLMFFFSSYYFFRSAIPTSLAGLSPLYRNQPIQRKCREFSVVKNSLQLISFFRQYKNEEWCRRTHSNDIPDKDVPMCVFLYYYYVLRKISLDKLKLSEQIYLHFFYTFFSFILECGTSTRPGSAGTWMVARWKHGRMVTGNRRARLT